MINFPVFYLDRPDAANALDVKTAKALEAALKKAVKEKITGFIITSRHPRVFCSGGDLRAYAKMKTKAQGINANRIIRKILQNFSRLPIFIVAAVEGDAIGGGCELCLACDHIIAGSQARFAFKQVRQNLICGWGGGEKLLQRVSPTNALDWLSSGRFISSDEALRQNLIDEVTAKAEALAQAQQWLSERPIDPSVIGALKGLASGQGMKEDKIFERLWFSKAHRNVLTRSIK